MPIVRIRIFSITIVLFGLLATLVGADTPPDRRESAGDSVTPIEPAPPDIDEARLFTELLAHNALRNAALSGYIEQRTYAVTDMNGRVRAEESGQMEYHAPDRKTFATTSESGSVLVRHLALNPLIASEIDATSAKQHHDSAITPANYSLELLGQQQVGPYRCFVAIATPKRPDKYLFEGKVWIDSQDYAVVRIEGRPAKKVSFWIERVHFVREFQKIEGFWLPLRDETSVQVRIYGQKILTINHQSYAISAAKNVEESVQDDGN